LFAFLSFRLTKIPTSELVNIKSLKKLDLGFNKLTQFDPELTEQIKLGLDVEYEGNKNK
jgi:hypothetical protein